MTENIKWYDSSDEILDLITPVEDEQGLHMDLTALAKGEPELQIPLKCPVCHERYAHVYMHRFPEDGQIGKGTIWLWCSHCKICTHVSRVRLPDWCENAYFIETSALTSHPVYLDMVADLIDEHLRQLLKKLK